MPGTAQPGARPGVWAHVRAHGGRAFAHGDRPGSPQKDDVGSTPAEDAVQRGLGQSRAGALKIWSVYTSSGCQVVERHLAEGEGACEGGPEVLVRYSQAHLHTQLGLWKQLLERGWMLHFSGVGLVGALYRQKSSSI